MEGMRASGLSRRKQRSLTSDLVRAPMAGAHVNHSLTNAPKLEEEGIPAGATFQGRYEILDEIGRGGFGTVYKAKQLATTQFVAIKVLRAPDQAGVGWNRRLARFVREMHLCGRLHHPNI